jgi:hypothetical protein
MAKTLGLLIVVCQWNGSSGSQHGPPVSATGGPQALPQQDVALTTVANWKHTGKDIVWQDETYYWSKHLEFQHFINLPSRSALPLELAIGGVSDDERADMRRHGWRVVPSVSLAEPSAYREYIRAARGEFTVAKDQNICAVAGSATAVPVISPLAVR